MKEPRTIDITGHRYGRLVAVCFAGQNQHKKALWRCACDCGLEAIVPSNGLRSGNTKSCGCLKRETDGGSLRTHGLSRTRAFARWKAARQRCNDPNAQNYRHYGGRGIRMAPEWSDFAAFFAEMGECPEKMSLDRIDPDRGYEPGNCRWATQAEQVRNFRTRNVTVEHDGHTLVRKDFSTLMGVNDSSLARRMKAYGETAHEAAARLRARQPHHQNTAGAAAASK